MIYYNYHRRRHRPPPPIQYQWSTIFPQMTQIYLFSNIWKQIRLNKDALKIRFTLHKDEVVYLTEFTYN